MSAVPQHDETVVADARWVIACIWIGVPLLSGVAGRLLLAVVHWAVGLPWVPYQGPIELIESINEPYATIGSYAVGFVAGLVLAVLIVADLLSLRITGERVVFTRDGKSKDVERTAVSGAFFDGKKIVLLGHRGEELAREPSDLTQAEVVAAFRAHGYPWLADGDPYKDSYRRWVEDTPDLPPGADALLKARARALDKDNSHDIAELRTELAKLGVVVREEKKRQYWRQID